MKQSAAESLTAAFEAKSAPKARIDPLANPICRDSVTATMETVLDSEGIKRLLPHRYPFLLVDRIIELRPLERIVGIKQVSANESFFQGHFPGAPVMPGVLVIEALAQCGAILP